MSKKEEIFRQYEKLIKEAAKEKGKIRYSCTDCPFRRSEFSYRTCLFSRCPFGKEKDVFRKKPLKFEKVTGREG